jgi:hypothetical protein
MSFHRMSGDHAYRFAADHFRRVSECNMLTRTYPINPPTTDYEERNTTNMTLNRDVLEREIDIYARRMEEAQNKLDLLATLPQDDEFDDGAVIFFKKRFNPGGLVYTYAAVKYMKLGIGYWSTTGPRAPKDIPWSRLLEFITDGVEEVWLAVEWERIIPS